MEDSKPQLVESLEDFILNPKRHAEAFEIVSELATYPCYHPAHKHVLLEQLLVDEGCMSCLSCRAREWSNPGIRARWTKRAIAAWNAHFEAPSKCELAPHCPNNGKHTRALRAHPHIMIRVCVQHLALESEIVKFLKHKVAEETKKA